ncbi:host cell division inhibitor Icd-like protein [Haemophilus haemolyticus]|uniref:host cell division inhibitor Icd-like protein n=1 Tax=Haemophilus haemolyticus TaxID=726 RepID=UPI003B980567
MGGYKTILSEIFIKNTLQSAVKFGIIFSQSEKVIASREKLNLYKANDSTPQNRAFFVRDIRTPQNKLRIFQHLSTIYSSMVERNEPSMTGCLPCMAVSHLVTFYRPTVRSLAVVPENLYKDTAEMIYKFLCVNRTQSHFNLCVISLNSTTEEQARLSLSADYRFIAVVARINPQNNRTLAALPTLSVSAEMEVAHG